MSVNLPTLVEATKRYRLRDASMSNAAIGESLGLANTDSDVTGAPSCCFFLRGAGYLAAIRVTSNELVVFHLFEGVQRQAEKIADPIFTEARTEARYEGGYWE